MFQVDVIEKKETINSRFFYIKDFYEMFIYIINRFKMYPTRIRVKIF